MLNLRDIKLIIWDLDDTLWNGIMSEGKTELNVKLKKLIVDTTDMGIVSSIASKNDYEKAKALLQELGLWDYFVFPSINWEPKGKRINGIITQMKLRSANVLFVDDNIQNLEEARYYNEGIMTALPTELDGIAREAEAAPKTDAEHKRLAQYRLLEEKESLKKEFSSNEEFLFSSNIRVELHDDCLEHIDRIHELIQRSNQLNYTKLRQSREELEALLNKSGVESGYVTVTDKFGDYGIVGFYAVENGKALHFLFSCRTLGMLVEQWVYAQIGFPEIEVNGEVVTVLNKTDVPTWINQCAADNTVADKKELGQKILFKGPCDLEQIFSFIKKDEKIVTEFTYVNAKGVEIEGTSHTAQFLTALRASEDEKKKLCGEFEWFDSKMLETALQNESFDTVYYSLLADANLGLYKRKGTDLYVALCQKCDDLTNEENHHALIGKKTFTSNINFNKEDLDRFSELYEYIDDGDFELTVSNLNAIYELTKNRVKKWVLFLGSEKEYRKNRNLNYVNRHLTHSIINAKIKNWAKNKENVEIIELGVYIENNGDYVDSINHFTKTVYYKMAQDIVAAADDPTLASKGKGALLYRTVRQKGRQILKKLKG